MNHFLRTVLAVALIALGATTAFAQSRVVSGTVTDNQGVPVIGAAVVGIDGGGNVTSVGTTTNASGEYSFSVPATVKSLQVTYIGYENATETIGSRTAVNFTLKESSVMMEEVVAIGYAKVKRKDLTGSTVSVMGSDLANIPVTTAAQALTGKAAGVNIVSQSGAPGADINITVRGGTSITQSTEPLYIVDGFQMEKGLQNIDINDIETIDVMKDASATAIYGAQGSNGVILITTKSGKAGKTTVQYNTYFSFEKLGKKLALLDVPGYVDYQYEYQMLRGDEAKWAGMFGGNLADPNFYTGAYARIASEYGNRAGIDWQDQIFGGHALTQNHNINVSGGNEKSHFMLSYNYNDQDGIFARHGYTKNSIRAKVDHEIAKGIRLDFNTNFNSTTVMGGGSMGGTLKKTIQQPVTGGVRYTNEQMLFTDLGDEMSAIDSQYDLNNPILENNAVELKKVTRQYSVNAGIEIDLYKGLTWRTAGSYTWQQARDTKWDDGTTRTAQNYKTEGQGEIHPWGYINNSERYTYQITNTLTYGATFAEKHTLNLLAGQETFFAQSINDKNTYYGFASENFGLNDIGTAQSYSRSSGISKNAIVSFFGRAMYNYDDRYLLTASVRADGSSKFAKGNKWGYFPSASAAWRISEEKFFKGHAIEDVINSLKLRIGYGTSGNCNIDNNMYATDYGSGHYAIGGKDYPTLKPGDTVGNAKLKWETTTSTNVGLDLAMLNNRINLTVEWYNNQSNDLLIKNSIPSSTGYKYQYQNIGSIRNRGVEIVLNTVNVNSKSGFRWTSDLNLSFNRSKVLSIYGEGENDYFDRDIDESSNGHCAYRIQVGQPIGQFFGYQYDGLYTTDDFTQNADGSYTLKPGVAYQKSINPNTLKPGDFKIKAVNGDVDADGNPVWSANDRRVIGNAQPKVIGGFTNTFTFKGVDLSVFMNFAIGGKIFNQSAQRFIGPYLPNQNTLADMNNRFRLVDPQTGKECTDLARLAAMNPQQYDKSTFWSVNAYNKLALTTVMDRYLEDGSYLRLNTITLGYTLPQSITRKAHISKLRFYLTLNNIHTFTGYSGYDPEVSATGSILTQGLDNSAYPRSKSYVIGMNLTF